MPNIRNVLQQRAERFRSKHVQKKLLREQQHSFLTLPNDDATDFTNQLIMKPQVEPEGISSGYMYSLEAKDTHATAVETFSSGEENTAYSDENDYTELIENEQNSVENSGEFLDLAYEASRQEKDRLRGQSFIDLVQESSSTRKIEIEKSDSESCKDDRDDADFTQPETIEFVDSEDGKIFNIKSGAVTTEEAFHHAGLLQNVRSLDDSNTLENDECSQTLNTNDETLQTMPRTNYNHTVQMNFPNQFCNVHVDAGEKSESRSLEVNTYENKDYGEQSELYDCDDGQMYYDDQGVQLPEIEEDGTFFEQLRNVQSRHLKDYETYAGSMGVIDHDIHSKHWQLSTKQTQFETNDSHLNAKNETLNSPQLEDPYLSDGDSSWEEGSFATGASRALSRVDSACDGHDDDDDVGTYDGTFDGTEYYSDDETYARRSGDRPFVRILKKFRDMNLGDDRSLSESSDEDEEEDREENMTRSKTKHKRRTKKKKSSVTFLDRLGEIGTDIREIGTDILNETIEYAEMQDKSPRSRKNRHQGGTIINSFADLFSCGAPSRY